jgi:adenylate cyclase, class 2
MSSESATTSRATSLEAEVKLACDNLDRLRDAGLELDIVEPRHFEDNWLLDRADKTLLTQGQALRIRFARDTGWITFKGPVRDGDSVVKVREEIEIETTAPERAIELFERLGFQRSFRYQKHRTVYRLNVEGRELKVVFDETPIGNFIEIEGNESTVARVFEASGFSAGDVIRESYPELQAKRCRERGVPLQDMVFE